MRFIAIHTNHQEYHTDLMREQQKHIKKPKKQSVIYNNVDN